MTQRIPFGLDRLPRALSPDDPRLPGVTVGAEKLRLNTDALPPEAVAVATPNHAARVAVMKQFLRGLCGDYAPLRLRFVDAYVDAMALEIAAHRDELSRALARYDGLYAPEDWLWSALRPLPRAWVPAAEGMVGVDVAFWDGTQVITIDLTGKVDALGLATCHVTVDVLDGGRLLEALPEAFRCFWQGELLPRSPFRRPIPRGVLNAVGQGAL